MSADRSTFRLTAVLCAILMVLAACSRPPERDSAAGRESGEVSEVEEFVDPEGTVVEPESTGTNATDRARRAANAQDTPPPAIENPAEDQEQILAVGRQIHAQSTDFPGGNRNTWAGVNDKEIIFAPGYDRESCGADLVAVITAAGGTLPTQSRFYRSAPSNQNEVRQETEETIAVLVKYFNETAWQGRTDYPNIQPIMERFGSPERPFYGRKIVAKTFDSGSFQCKEKANNAATIVGDQIKAFASFVDRWDGTPTILAEALHAKIPANRRPMTFGTLWLPDSYYSKWAPYVWTQFSSGSTIVRQKASWACSRLVGKPAVNSPDYSGQERKFGLIYPNRTEDRDRANEFKAALQQYCGRNIIEPGAEKTYTMDVSRAADEGQQMMLQMRSAGITSIFMLADPVMPLFQINQARSMGYDPEYIFSSMGYADSNTVQRLYDLNRNGIGLSQLGVYGGFGYQAGDPFWAYHHSHRIAPDGKPCDPSSEEGMSRMRPDGGGRNSEVEQFCKAPTAIATYYYTMLPLIGGLIFAGPNLTPENVSKGLQAYPETRFGGNGPTTDPRPALVGAGTGKYNFITDAVEWRWRTGYTSPYPEHKAEGWVEYTDCMRHYTLWPDQMALYWEQGGPNFNAWCGNEKYAPADSEEKDGYPRITEGTNPS